MSGGGLSGRVALVTGASRGLGKAMALALAEDRPALALVGRDAALLEDTAREARARGSDAEVFTADVSSESEVAALRQSVIARFGKLDILINNAGINLRKPITDFTYEEWRRVMDTNVTSVFLMCRAFVPHMKGRGYGRIFNLTSTMSHVSLPERSVYSASKTALLGLTRALALELAPEGITVVGISPGPFGTEMNTALIQNPEINAFFMAKTPVGRWGKVEEVGALARFLCADEAGFITGTDILIDGGWCAQ